MNSNANWWRRAGGILLGVLVLTALLAQLLGTLIFRRSWPDGTVGWLLSAIAFVAVVIVSAVFSRDGQSPTQRLLGVRVLNRAGEPAPRTTLALRNLAHLADYATLGVGFLWPLWDARGQTFADKIMGTTVHRVPASVTART